MELSVVGWCILVLVALIIGISKTGVPGVGILAVVLMVFAVGTKHAEQSNGLTLMMLLVGDVIAVAWYRRHGDWSHLVRLLPPAAVGIVAGFLFADAMKAHHLNHLLGQFIGGIVLALLLLNRWWTSNPDRHIPHHWSFAVAVGGAAGFTTMMSNAAGPLLIMYLLAMGLEKQKFIGTSAWYFLLLNSFKVPFMSCLGWITPATLKLNLAMAPVVVLGAVLGILFAQRIPQRAFRLVMEAITFVAAAILLVYPWLDAWLRRVA